jgi:hypothetical protein
MMMIFHLALSLELIALVLGVGLYVWSHQVQGNGTGLARVIGLIVVVISILGVLCTSYSGYKAWQEEMYFRNMMHMQNIQSGTDMMPVSSTSNKSENATTKTTTKKH